MKLKIENATKIQTKIKNTAISRLKPLRSRLCVVVSMYVYMGEGVCVCVYACFSH